MSDAVRYHVAITILQHEFTKVSHLIKQLIIVTRRYTMHAAVLIGAACAVLLARVLLPFVRGIFSPLRTIPGPVAARFTDLWYFWRVKRGYFEVDNVELHRRYGNELLKSPEQPSSTI